MQVTETQAEGLKREFRVVIGAADLDQRLDTKLQTMKGQISMKGFRPGKVPLAFLKKVHGKSLLGEIVQEAISESTRQMIEERALRPALQPAIEFENTIEKVVDEGADLTFKVAFEVLPEFELADLKTLSLTRPVAEVQSADVEAALKRLAEQQRTYEAKAEDAEAEAGDALTIDFEGKIDGVAFPGGKGEDVRLVIGSGSFIPGFEDQLIGAKAGSERCVAVTFPEDYGEASLAGKAAEFNVTVHELRAPKEAAVDEDLAQRFGLESLDKLKEVLSEQIKQDYKAAARQHLKRQLLDALDGKHDFELPPGMVEAEFAQIWHDIEHAHEHGHLEDEDAGKSLEELKPEYRKIAERRVRLGLILAEIGRGNEITVSQDEISRAIGEQARGYPGQEQAIYQYYQKNPQAIAQLRAPLFEDKVVDFIIELAQVTDHAVTKEELFRDPDGDHDHDHDHDHGSDGEGGRAEKDAEAAGSAEPKRKPRAKAKSKRATEDAEAASGDDAS